MGSTTEYARKHRKQVNEIIEAAKSAGCLFCREQEPICLDFHHINPANKEFAVGGARMMATKRVIAEIAKCVVLCANCHRKLHAGLLHL